jgi:hypothetical protein
MHEQNLGEDGICLLSVNSAIEQSIARVESVLWMVKLAIFLKKKLLYIIYYRFHHSMALTWFVRVSSR